MVKHNNLLRRLTGSLCESGLKTTILKLYAAFADILFDFRYGVNTRTEVELETLTIESKNREKCRKYQPSRVKQLRKLLSGIKPILPADGVFVDFGSGKGRVLLVASEFGFKEARGVEFARELCEIAKMNCQKFKKVTGTQTEFHIIESDAVDYAIRADEQVFFLYNPFGEEILSRVLSNINNSMQTHPRKILIIYHNPEAAHLMEKWSGITKTYETNIWDCCFYVYQSSLGGGENRLDPAIEMTD